MKTAVACKMPVSANLNIPVSYPNSYALAGRCVAPTRSAQQSRAQPTSPLATSAMWCDFASTTALAKSELQAQEAASARLLPKQLLCLRLMCLQRRHWLARQRPFLNAWQFLCQVAAPTLRPSTSEMVDGAFKAEVAVSHRGLTHPCKLSAKGIRQFQAALMSVDAYHIVMHSAYRAPGRPSHASDLCRCASATSRGCPAWQYAESFWHPHPAVARGGQ